MNAKQRTISMTPSQCRDPANWRRSYYKDGRMTVMYNSTNNTTRKETWTEIFDIKDTKHGKGLFSLVHFKTDSPVCAYPGKLFHENERPQERSDMVMQSGISKLLIVATKYSWSGGSFVNDVKGAKKTKNVKISVKTTQLRNRPDQQKLFKQETIRKGGKLTGIHPEAIGLTVPIYRSTKNIKPGDQILTSYNWSNEDWKNATTVSNTSQTKQTNKKKRQRVE